MWRMEANIYFRLMLTPKRMHINQSINLPIYLSICLSYICLSIFIYRRLYLFIYLSIYLSIFLSMYLSIYLSIYSSILYQPDENWIITHTYIYILPSQVESTRLRRPLLYGLGIISLGSGSHTTDCEELASPDQHQQRKSGQLDPYNNRISPE